MSPTQVRFRASVNATQLTAFKPGDIGPSHTDRTLARCSVVGNRFKHDVVQMYLPQTHCMVDFVTVA